MIIIDDDDDDDFDDKITTIWVKKKKKKKKVRIFVVKLTPACIYLRLLASAATVPKLAPVRCYTYP